MLDAFIVDDPVTFEEIDSIYENDEIPASSFLNSIKCEDAGISEEFDIQHTSYADSEGMAQYLQHNHDHLSPSFGSFGSCHEWNCLCKGYEGTYGAVCSNCYHGFDKHW